MNKITLTFLLSLFVGLGFFTESSRAQINPNNSGYQENEQDPTTGGTFGNDFNPMDFIHNANFRRSRNSSEFQNDTQSELQNAAEKFKRQQQESIQNKPVTTPPSREN
ncbi:hypothetical protein [Chroococcus sp. FPU101]|uniref:hypothetical protein n=1 Tax=Chroococcus sp. FPU101 TaxID=1974212 RepID=UPI001A8F768D|nr:hypothetical protein [Chroococcus sp. FPU101]GFE70368.1 hypothetical protein CFPU101_29780 [Chroococcus sp. FPU101]